MGILEGYTGSIDVRGMMLRCNAAREKMEAAHARILEQFCSLGFAYTEVVDEPSVDYDELYARISRKRSVRSSMEQC
jgi:hypothetical protein